MAPGAPLARSPPWGTTRCGLCIRPREAREVLGCTLPVPLHERGSPSSGSDVAITPFHHATPHHGDAGQCRETFMCSTGPCPGLQQRVPLFCPPRERIGVPYGPSSALAPLCPGPHTLTVPHASTRRTHERCLMCPSGPRSVDHPPGALS